MHEKRFWDCFLSMTFSVICSCALHVNLAIASPFENRSNDLLVAFFWMPEQCYISLHAEDKNCMVLSEKDRSYLHKMHGIWGNVQECTKEKFDPDSIGEDVMNQLMMIYYDDIKLIQHEWEKHGACMKVTQREYFSEVIQEYMRNLVPSFVTENLHECVSLNDLHESYGVTKVQSIQCYIDKFDGKQYFSEIRLYTPDNIHINGDMKTNCNTKELICIRGV